MSAQHNSTHKRGRGRPTLYKEKMKVMPFAIPPTWIEIYQRWADTHYSGNLSAALRDGLAAGIVYIQKHKE